MDNVPTFEPDYLNYEDDIICPWCNYKHVKGDITYVNAWLTFAVDNDACQFICPNCKNKIYIESTIKRIYKVTKVE